MSKKVSLTEKYLPSEVWRWLSMRTSYGTTIYDCVKSAIENPDSSVGLYAPDAEAYDVFHELFHPVIGEYHKVDVNTLESKHELGNADELCELPSEMAARVVSTRVRVGRTVKGFPMAAKLTSEKRVELEALIKRALDKLDGTLAGTYKSLVEMTVEERRKLIDDHILYADATDKYLASAGGYNDWPLGRGIFMNNDKNFFVWVNEEDHIRIITMQKGASLKEVWGRLTKAIGAMEQVLEFERHPKFGYLTFCPTNIGTALRASVHVRIPRVGESDAKLKEICAPLDLQPRGVDGEHTESKGGVYDISNKIRIGRTEWQLINTMWTGVKKLLDEEFKQ